MAGSNIVAAGGCVADVGEEETHKGGPIDDTVDVLLEIDGLLELFSNRNDALVPEVGD